MADIPWATWVAGLALDSADGAERIPVLESTTPAHFTTDTLSAYVIGQLTGSAVVTPTVGDALIVERGGTAGTFDLNALSDYVIGYSFTAAANGAPAQASDSLIVDRSGTKYELALSDIVTLANADVLDLTSLTTGTPGASDLILYGSGTSPRAITLTNFESQVFTDFATYVDGLSEVTTTTANDKYFVLQGGTAKFVDSDTLSAFFNVTNGDVLGPIASTENNVPQWDAANKTLKEGLSLVTTVRTVAGGAADTSLATEQAVAELAEALPITGLDIDGGTDIGAALVDSDLIIVDDGAGGTNRKSALSRVWTYALTKLIAVTDVSTHGWVVDEDAMTSDSATKVPTQQSVKAYVDSQAVYDGDIADLDIDGATDIAADLADNDLIIVDDGASGANRRSSFSRVWSYILAKIVAVADVSAYGWVLDEDNFASDSATKVPTQQSVKAYVDSVAGTQNNLAASADPTATNDTTQGYSVGSTWVNTTSDTAFICVDATASAAIWTSTTAAAAGWDGDVNDVDFATGSDIGADLADTDQVVVGDNSDSNNAKRSAMSRVRSYVNKVQTASYAANQTLTAAECNGYVVYVTGAATITLPPVADGMSVTILTIGNVAVSVDPNASDLIYLDGVALDDGDKITNGSASGDMAVLTYHSSVGWYAATNGWTDGGA